MIGNPHGGHLGQRRGRKGVRRPAAAGFNALLKRLQPGDSLVAWKVDRLGRDALAALTIARDLDARGVRIVITTLGVDSSTPAGRMVFGVLAQLAEFERATLVERTNAGLAAARKRGTHLGRRFRLTPHQQREARRMRSDEGQTYAQIAALFRVLTCAAAGLRATTPA